MAVVLRIMIVSFCVGLCQPVLGQGHQGEWRTFTAADGRTMQAQVLKVREDSVRVRLRANNREVDIAFDKLSENDVQLLKEYANAGSDAGGLDDRDFIEDADDDGEGGNVGGLGEEPGDEAMPGEPSTGRLYPRTKQEIQAGIRDILKRPAPKGIAKDVQKAVNQLNLYRFLCGVSYDVVADAKLSEEAKDAANACKEHGGLSHDLGRSTDKCNLSTMGSIEDSVGQYINDPGENNREKRGHRAWCLNAPMKKAGFGSAGQSYSAMWCMDTSGKGVRGTWGYPGKGLFPLQYLHGNAWSLYGLGDVSGKIEVEIYKLSTRPERSFTAREEIPGRKIAVEYVSKTMNGINFEPSQPVRRGVYWVRVKAGRTQEGYLVELY